MADIHIIIQRWFKTGHGTAFDNSISRTQRSLLEDAIAQAENYFDGTTSIENTESYPNQYINVLVELDDECPDILARNPRIAIGIWSSEELTKERIDALRQKALTITRRGGYPTETFGIQPPTSLSPRIALIGLSLLLILCLLGFSICRHSKSSEETTGNIPVVQNEPFITQPVEDSKEEDSGEPTIPEQSKSSVMVVPSPNNPTSEESTSGSPEIIVDSVSNNELPASSADAPVAPMSPSIPPVVVSNKPKSANWTQFKTDNNDVDLLNGKFKIDPFLKFNQDNRIIIREHKQLNCLIEFLNTVIKTARTEETVRHPDVVLFLSRIPKQTIEFLPAQPTDEQISLKYSEIKGKFQSEKFQIETLSSLINCLDYNSYYTKEKSFSFDGTAEISPKLHELIISLSLNNQVDNEQTENARILYNLLKQWDVKGIFEDDCQKRPWFIVAVFFNYLNSIRDTLKSGNIDTVPLPKEPMNVGQAKEILQNKGGIIQELKDLMPPSEYKSDSDLNAFLEEFMPYWRLKLRLWKKQVHTDCPSTFNTLLE